VTTVPAERVRGRPLKRWRWVGAFSPELMLCAAAVRVGPLPMRFFAVAEPGRPIVDATPLWPRAVVLDGSRVSVRTRRASFEVQIEEDGGVETLHAGGTQWTRKQAGIRARVTGVVGERRHDIDARAVVDDTAGYHPRQTRWLWSAGVGTTREGSRVGWNLVSGINDEPHGSERAIWVDGAAHEPGPVEFDGDRIAFAEGGELAFSEWSAREADINLLLLRSRYRAPFGTFSGDLPGAGALAEGYGVMEWHEAYW
jgi:hypothetical protein